MAPLDRPAAPDQSPSPSGGAHASEGELSARIAELEQLVQGLQDSVYRENQRQEKRIEDLERRLEPSSLAAALSKDARERGL